MNDKRKPVSKQQPVHTIQAGDVTATIHLRQSHCGHQYYDYVLTRTWASLGTGKVSRGGAFFDSNLQEVVEAATKASAWIRQRTQGQVVEEDTDVTPTNSQQKSS